MFVYYCFLNIKVYVSFYRRNKLEVNDIFYVWKNLCYEDNINNEAQKHSSCYMYNLDRLNTMFYMKVTCIASSMCDIYLRISMSLYIYFYKSYILVGSSKTLIDHHLITIWLIRNDITLSCLYKMRVKRIGIWRKNVVKILT